MADKQPTIWARAPHTAAKHLILRSYLGAWLPKLAWTKKVIFIDGFAGPGEYSHGEQGSPLIALETAITHRGDLSDCELVFFFVERDKDRFDHLSALLEEVDHPENVKFQAVSGEFQDHMSEILDRLDAEGKGLAPALIMVDPFGWTGMPLDLIARAAQHKRSEFLISFMYESMTRFLRNPEQEANFDELFGCADWRQAVNLSGDDRKKFLLNLYVSQLRRAGLEYVLPFEMIDEGNRTEYFLIFATHSLDGLRAIKAAMWSADPTGSYRFSDASMSAQLTLLPAEPDYAQLKKLILGRFSGQDVPISELEVFVLVDTLFRETHYKKQILVLMEKAGELKVLTERKRKYTYPVGTILRFPDSGS